MPLWTEKIMNPGNDFEKLALSWFVVNTTTTETMKLKPGFLLKEILDRCTNKTKSMLTPDRSLWMYFAHDITISYLLQSLKLYTVEKKILLRIFNLNMKKLYILFDLLQLHRVPFAACIILELYQSANGPYIQVIYKSSTRKNTDPLDIPNCGPKCPLEKFYELYADILPTKSFDEECMVNDVTDSSAG